MVLCLFCVICRLKLADILVQPMQRLTKYCLLLQAIRKNVVDESDTDLLDAMVSEKRKEVQLNEWLGVDNGRLRKKREKENNKTITMLLTI